LNVLFCVLAGPKGLTAPRAESSPEMPRPGTTRGGSLASLAALLAVLLAAGPGCRYTKTIAAEDYLAQGISALEEGRMRDASRAFREARKAAISPHILARIGLAYSQAAMCPQAVPFLARSLRRMPRHPVVVRLALIGCLSRMGRAQQAEQVLADALKVHYNDAMALNNLGYLAADRGLHVETALRLLERAAHLEPTSAEIVDSVGWAHYRLHHLREARRWLERAVALEKQPELLYHLGVVCRDMGDMAAARVYLRRALRLDPRFRPAADELLRMGYL